MAIRSFYIMPCFFIQVNNKLDVEVQSVTRILVYGVKNVFKKFKWCLVKEKVGVLHIRFQSFVTPTIEILFWFKDEYSVFRFSILKFGFQSKK